MHPIFIREPKLNDHEIFLAAMQRSQSLHSAWIKAPLTRKEYAEYWERYQQANHKSFLLWTQTEDMVGVFNISEIVRGAFQNAYLGFYAVADYAGKGYMSAGLKLVLTEIFTQLKLHRIEANIQPENFPSIQLVKQNGFRYEGFSPRYLQINHEWRGHEHWAMTYEDFMREDKDILAKDHVEIVSSQPSWPDDARREIEKLKSVLPLARVIDMQHIGSTAIPGLAAKPIIDIQIAVKSLDEMKVVAVQALQKLGYEYWADNPDAERMFFVKGMPPYGKKRTHHVHIVEPTSKHWKEKLMFRDYLIAHPEIAKAYEQLKLELAQQHSLDREQYTAAKGDFVNKVLNILQKNKS